MEDPKTATDDQATDRESWHARVPAILWEHPDLTPHARLAYAALCKYRNHATGKCWPSLDALKRDTQLTRNRLVAVMRELEAYGLIIRDRHKPTPKTRVTYTLPDHPQELPEAEEYRAKRSARRNNLSTAYRTKLNTAYRTEDSTAYRTQVSTAYRTGTDPSNTPNKHPHTEHSVNEQPPAASRPGGGGEDRFAVLRWYHQNYGHPLDDDSLPLVDHLLTLRAVTDLTGDLALAKSKGVSYPLRWVHAKIQREDAEKPKPDPNEFVETEIDPDMMDLVRRSGSGRSPPDQETTETHIDDDGQVNGLDIF